MRIAGSLLFLSLAATLGQGRSEILRGRNEVAVDAASGGFFEFPSMGVRTKTAEHMNTNSANATDDVVDPRLEGSWYTAKGDPKLIDHWDNDKYVVLKVTPNSETTSLKSKALYQCGRLEIQIKSAAVMPGVVTAVYLTNGDGRKSDEELGDQDEIDLEFRGILPNTVQTNVFLSGEENLKVVDLPYDSSWGTHTYTIEWDEKTVKFFVDGNPNAARTVDLSRPLKPMNLHLSVWTTSNGWPGLLKWGGETKWAGHADTIEAAFTITQFPYAV